MTLTEFMDERYKNREDKDNMFGVGVSDAEFRHFIIDYLLGEDWYVVDPLGQTQINEIALYKILEKRSKRYRKECRARIPRKWMIRKKVTKLNRLETEIENHRMRAIMSENVGNTNASKDEWYLYECLSALKNIQDSGDCNVCSSRKNCQYTPTLGQMVRYNCPFYKKEGD